TPVRRRSRARLAGNHRSGGHHRRAQPADRHCLGAAGPRRPRGGPQPDEHPRPVDPERRRRPPDHGRQQRSGAPGSGPERAGCTLQR
ncbi:Uncharacterized protein APZ42_002391, partial [Daphnia magna]